MIPGERDTIHRPLHEPSGIEVIMRILILLLAFLVFASDLRAYDMRPTDPSYASEVESILGAYTSPAGDVSVIKAGYGAAFVSCGDWQSVGFYQDSAYAGIVRMMGPDHRPASTPDRGSLHFRLQPDGHIRAELGWSGKKTSIVELWIRSEVLRDRTPRPETVMDTNLRSVMDEPKFGDYVYVEELPEAITKVPPVYPDEARRAGVQGVVLVQALVRKDGTVGDVKVIQSIPLLDLAAIQAVRQWIFKPARAKGEPVSVWVATPIKFTLH
jgi:protein TonB